MRRRQRWLWLAAALLAAVPCGAEIPISGLLLAPGGEPLTGAPVRLLPARDGYQAGVGLLEGRLLPEPAAETRSGEDGRFELIAPEAGLWDLRVDPEGYVPMSASLQPLLEETHLPPVTLEPDRPLEVVVRGPGGTPLAGAVVTGRSRSRHLWSTARFQRRSWFRAPGRALAGADGATTLHRAEGERLEVRAFAPGHLPAGPRQSSGGRLELTLKTGDPTPIAVSDAGGEPVAGALVLLGEQRWAAGRTGADGRLAATLGGDRVVRALTAEGARGATRAPGDAESVAVALTAPAVLTGRVIDREDRQPVAAALVWSSHAILSVARSDDEGRFRLPTMRHGGRSHLRAAATGYFEERLEVGDSQGFEPVIALAAAAAVTGEVVGAGGDPVAGAEVTAATVPSSRASFRGMRAAPIRGLSREGGAFRLAGLSPGAPLELTARADGYAPTTLAIEPLEARETRTGLRLALSPGVVLSGRLLGAGQPVAGAELGLTREPESSSPMALFARRMSRQRLPGASDGEGAFEYRDLAAGTYLLTVKAPGFARLLVPGIELEPGGTDLGTLELEPGVEIRGVVVDDQGGPVAGAEVRIGGQRSQIVSLLGDGGEEPPVTAGTDGSFLVPDRRAGERVDLTVSHDEHQQATVQSIEAPTVEPVTVVLRRAATIAGQVLDPGGGPVADASVGVTIEEADAAGTGDSRAGFQFPTFGQTDEAGYFEIRQAPTGRVRVTATAEGWLPAEIGALELAPGGKREGLSLVLERGATVTGQVRAADGFPAVGAWVSVEQPRTAAVMMRGAQTRTDGDGRYLLGGVEPGLRLITARDRERNSVAREIEVVTGTNRLDLSFAGGVEVSGRVVDRAGAPVVGAGIMLQSDAGSWGGAEAISASDGSFTIAGVRDGQYVLRVTRDGYATRLLEEPLQVAGAPLTGIEVVLESGGSISGRLLGLDEGQLAAVTVMATDGEAHWSLGQVSHDGSYRVPHLPAADWTVQAMVPQGPQARGTVTLAPGAAEAVLDLDFAAGLVVAGRVLRDGQPLAGVRVHLRGTDVSGWHGSGTDHEGRFRIEGLEPGGYRLEVYDRGTVVQHRREIQLEDDLDLLVEVSTGRIAGRVLDAEAKLPVAGATATLELAAEPESDGGWAGSAQATSDNEGRFVIARVAAADYRLKIVKEGYAPAERSLSVAAGADLADLEIALEPNTGLRLRVLGASGAAVAEVDFAVLDAAGSSLTSGRRNADEEGHVRLPSVPAGSFELLVSAPGAAVRQLDVRVPGPVVAVRLEPACSLVVTVEELADEGLLGTLKITGARGAPFVGLRWGRVQRQWELRLGSQTVGGLPAGGYDVEVTAADGRSWRGSVRLSPGLPTRLAL